MEKQTKDSNKVVIQKDITKQTKEQGDEMNNIIRKYMDPSNMFVSIITK